MDCTYSADNVNCKQAFQNVQTTNQPSSKPHSNRHSLGIGPALKQVQPESHLTWPDLEPLTSRLCGAVFRSSLRCVRFSHGLPCLVLSSAGAVQILDALMHRFCPTVTSNP